MALEPENRKMKGTQRIVSVKYLSFQGALIASDIRKYNRDKIQDFFSELNAAS